MLSSDLRNHAVGRHLMPLLRNYDRDRIEIYGYTPWDYPNDPMQREITGLIKSFRPVADMRVRDIAEFIRRDEIDILFEFNGHTLGSKTGGAGLSRGTGADRLARLSVHQRS